MSREEKESVARLLQVGRENGFWRRGLDYPTRARQLFGDIDLRGKHVLEVGCGRGEFCLWASVQGACRVVGLEPMSDGYSGTGDQVAQFRRLVARLALRGVEMRPSRLQEHETSAGNYDVVLSVASVNHLDEAACIHLHEDPQARARFLSIFTRLRSIMAIGGKLIIIDAMRRNLFTDIGLRNPFNPDVEGFKHQEPAHWQRVLSDAGFEAPRVTYLGNRFCRYAGLPYIPRGLSYCLDSQFRLEMTAAE